MSEMTIQASTPTSATAGTTLPRVGGARTLPASSGTGAAPLRNNGYRVLQVVLFVSGAVLLPLGLIVIVLGWYGAAHTPYEYDQISYLVSGGMLGLGLTFCGGFLYFGAWLARIAADNRDTAKRLSDTLLVLADVVSRSAAVGDGTVRSGAVGSAPARDAGSVLVVAGSGRTVHRSDCSLIAHRDDLVPAGGDAPDLAPCRLCKPV